METPKNPPVTVDPGDLDEAIQSATAWAGFLRKRGELGMGRPTDHQAADRIDQACSRLNAQSRDSLLFGLHQPPDS